MAMAVQRLFPGSKVTIGPWIDNGFYYDFDMEPLADRDLKRIKKEMVSLNVFLNLGCRLVVSQAYSLAYCFRVQNSYLESSVGSNY